MLTIPQKHRLKVLLLQAIAQTADARYNQQLLLQLYEGREDTKKEFIEETNATITILSKDIEMLESIMEEVKV